MSNLIITIPPKWEEHKTILQRDTAGRVAVCRYIRLPNKTTGWQLAANWEALESEAKQFLGDLLSVLPDPVQSAEFPCPKRLADLAQWAEVKPTQTHWEGVPIAPPPPLNGPGLRADRARAILVALGNAPTAPYLAAWEIADRLGVERNVFMTCSPPTEYDLALLDLVQGGYLAPVPDLDFRYSLTPKGQEAIVFL